MSRRVFIWLFVGGMLAPFMGRAQQPDADLLVVDPEDTAYREGRYYFHDQLYIFVDSLADRPIEEVASAPFQAIFHKDTTGLFKKWIGDMGREKACVWARLTIVSRVKEKEEWLIQISAGEVDFFESLGDGQFSHQVTGTSLAVNQKPLGGSYGVLACLPLSLPAQDTITLYFKLREVNSHIGNNLIMAFDRTIFKPQVFVVEARNIRFFDILTLGILLAVAIYHFIIFFYQRQSVSLFFGFFVLFLAVVIMGYGGYSQELVTPGMTFHYGASIIAVALQCGSVFHYLFSRKYLELPKLLPSWDRIWSVLILIQIVSTILFVYTMVSAGGPANADSVVAYKIVLFRVLSPLPILFYAMVVAGISLFKGNKASGLYLLAMSTYIFQHLANQAGFDEMVHIPTWVFSFSGEAVMVLLFALGIASQLRTLQRQKLAAEQAELRLKDLDAFKTRFYTNITHQFRTPITVILGMIDQIQAHPSTWMQKGANMIRRNGQRLLHLVNQILDLSKLEAGQMPVHLVRYDVIQYLRYIVESFHSSAEQKRIDLRFQAEPAELVVDYDPDKLMDILSNLLSNALKFTPEGGRVEVMAGVAPDRLEQFFIRVKDSGSGIPEAALDRVFDRFFQSETGQGTGIGLALTHELVHLLHGDISVTSKPGKGADFFITLPITRTAPMGHTYNTSTIRAAMSSYLHPKNNELETDAPKEVSGRPTVLIVEDSPDVVAYLQAVLSSRFQIKVAQNGIEGLEKARKIIPDLIVSDIMMPEMDGLEMCQALKTDRLTSHIPIILLTAKSDHTSRIEGLRTGADAFLAKPFDKSELLVRVDKLIELRAKLQERYREIRFLFQTPQETGSHPEDQFMHELRRIIEANLGDEQFSVTQLCKKMGMSRAQLYKKFKALTDQSIADFIRRVRLHKAYQLLQTTGQNVTEVSMETGFKNHSSFSRSFKEEFGVSPREVQSED